MSDFGEAMHRLLTSQGESAEQLEVIKDGTLWLGHAVTDFHIDTAPMVEPLTGIHGRLDFEVELIAQLTPEAVAGLMQVLRCGGCGVPFAELPPGHTWREGEECRDD